MNYTFVDYIEEDLELGAREIETQYVLSHATKWSLKQVVFRLSGLISEFSNSLKCPLLCEHWALVEILGGFEQVCVT